MWQAAFRKFLTVTKDEKVAPRIPKGIVFFGETFGVFNGSKIQHLTYGRDDLDMKLFAAYDPAKNEYLLPAEFEALCDEYGLPRVQFHRAIFTTVADFDKIANTPSEVTDKHHREGIVLCSEERRCVFGKVISFEYLENNSRTEGH
jgi:ATP-dependent RNA circularization protein (DNA/RNA ligase family)